MTIHRATPDKIKAIFEQEKAFILDFWDGNFAKDYESLEEWNVGEGGYFMPAIRAGGMNHIIRLYKGSFSVEVRSSPWLGGLESGKRAAAAVAAKLEKMQ